MGGFFDHVPPDNAPDVQPAFQRRGCRVPALLISPFAKRQHVSSQVFDHTSILRLIEWRWNLSPLSVRDATASNLALALRLRKRPKPDAAPYAVPPFVSAGCTPPPAAPAAAAPTSAASRDDDWSGLADLARQHGYGIG